MNNINDSNDLSSTYLITSVNIVIGKQTKHDQICGADL
jgi:hypothetical protein